MVFLHRDKASFIRRRKLGRFMIGRIVDDMKPVVRFQYLLQNFPDRNDVVFIIACTPFGRFFVSVGIGLGIRFRCMRMIDQDRRPVRTKRLNGRDDLHRHFRGWQHCIGRQGSLRKDRFGFSGGILYGTKYKRTQRQDRQPSDEHKNPCGRTGFIVCSATRGAATGSFHFAPPLKDMRWYRYLSQ